MKRVVLAVLLGIAGALLTAAAFTVGRGVGLAVAGVAVAVWACLFLLEVPARTPVHPTPAERP